MTEESRSFKAHAVAVRITSHTCRSTPSARVSLLLMQSRSTTPRKPAVIRGSWSGRRLFLIRRTRTVGHAAAIRPKQSAMPLTEVKTIRCLQMSKIRDTSPP